MTVEIHDAERVPKELLHEHPRNSNKQSRHEFAETRKSIRENGFDETLLVMPRDEGGYWIVSGNHRYRAGVAEGMDEFPCVVRDSWDDAKGQVELVRRNLRRGKIDKDAFTVAVDALAEDEALSVDEIRQEMGFEDPDMFLQYYQQEDTINDNVQRSRSENAPKVKMVDDLGMVLSGIFEEYGDTVDQSFIIFPAGGRKHMYIAATPALKRILESVAQKCIAEHMDINLVLGGLLVIGMENSHFKLPTADKERIVDAGSEDGNASFD